MGRIYGPHSHRRGWRVVVLDEDGHRSSQICETYEEAHDLIRGLDSAGEAEPGLRVGTAVDR